MTSSTSLELNLSLKPSYVPKTITELLKDLSHVDNASDKLAVLNDYINQHEEELRSIMAFKRQLPQCMLLLMEALGTLKNEYMNIKNGMETENGRPLGEFLANKGKYYEQQMDRINYESKRKGLMSCFSAQLWNSICSTCENKKLKTAMDLFQSSNQNPISVKESNTKPEKVSNNSNNVILRGSCSKFASGVVTEDGLCGLNLNADDKGTLNYHPKPLTLPIWKNNRRTWTPELHARFVEALNLLGGIQVATPKQIREVMQVQGLTNDQVKSHLQKYRLHRRMLPENYGECSGNFQDPWLPQIYYGEPLSPEDSDDENNNNGNPEEGCKGKKKNLKSNDADL